VWRKLVLTLVFVCGASWCSTHTTGAVLTAKHGCGHLLWPTAVTLPDGSPYSYAVGKEKSAIKADVLKMFSDSCQAASAGFRSWTFL
jgi:hypothetical protein